MVGHNQTLCKPTVGLNECLDFHALRFTPFSVLAVCMFRLFFGSVVQQQDCHKFSKPVWVFWEFSAVTPQGRWHQLSYARKSLV